MTTTIQKWGNSRGIRIPKFILDDICWKENETIELITKDDSIIITKAKKHKNIKELFDGFEGEYVPENISWGEPVGEEIW